MMKLEMDEYEAIPRVKRLAMFLVLMGPEPASEILRRLDRNEADRIAKEMASVEMIDEATQIALVEEFASVLAESFGSVGGGREVALKALREACGDAHARNVVGDWENVKPASELVAAFDEMDPGEIAWLIADEQPQTIAFVLSLLDPGKSASVLTKIDSEQRGEIILKMAAMDATPGLAPAKVLRHLEKRVDTRVREPRLPIGGADRAADLLKCLKRDETKGLLKQLGEADAAIAALVSRGLFSFDDLISLSNQDLQRVLRDVESSSLVIAMKPASQALKEKILGALSKRAAESLREELEFLGSVRRKEVDAARDAIVESVFRLEENDEISLGKGDEDVIS